MSDISDFVGTARRTAPDSRVPAIGRRRRVSAARMGLVSDGARIPYERYFEVAMVPPPGVSARSYEYLRRIVSDVTECHPVYDAHTHVGSDRDGRALTADELVAELDRFHVAGAVVFPFNDPRQGADFREPNDLVWQTYERLPDRIVPFMRLSPNGPWEREYVRCRDRGHRGIKLHPRAQHFSLRSAVARELCTAAAADGLPILIHTGFGMAGIAEDIAGLVTAIPDLTIVLGHSSFTDMPEALWKLAPFPNVYFETSVVQVYDLFDVLMTIDPRRIIYGSDLPYAGVFVAMQTLATMAHFSGVGTDHFPELFGGNLLRILPGEGREVS